MEGLTQNPEIKNASEVTGKLFRFVLTRLGIPQEEQEAYIKNNAFAHDLLDPMSKYFDMESCRIDMAGMISETGLDIAKTLMFRGAHEKELKKPDAEVCTYWTTELSAAISYAKSVNKEDDTGVILITTLNNLPNLNNLEQHIYPGTVVAYGEAPEILAHLKPEEFDNL